MRGIDEDTGEYLGPSRSQNRREALEVLELAEKLVALTEAQLARLPVPESLLPHIRETRRITARIAHKRQLAFLAKQMRREDAATHRVEAWRERLLADGDAALAELLDEHPTADRQHLRQLVRSALDERTRGKPPRAYRELYRALRELLLGGATAGDRDDDETSASGPDGT